MTQLGIAGYSTWVIIFGMDINRPVLTYAPPDFIEAGFALGQPVLDVYLNDYYSGCLFRSYRNAGRRLEETNSTAKVAPRRSQVRHP